MRALIALLALVTLVACSDGRDLDEPPAPLGDFKLGHSIVIAPNLVKGPLSREASKEQWVAAMDKAVEDRFRRYEGDDKKLYHFGISIEGYVLAQVGVPLVLQPKSVLIFRVTVWDDVKGVKLNEEPHEITVLEAPSAETFAGSGLTQTAEEQLDNLVIKGTKQLEVWLGVQQKRHDWFTPNARVEKSAEGKKSNKDAKPVN
ncbi:MULTISPECIES: hypothetical protein [unclassified Marinovum]